MSNTDNTATKGVAWPRRTGPEPSRIVEDGRRSPTRSQEAHADYGHRLRRLGNVKIPLSRPALQSGRTIPKTGHSPAQITTNPWDALRIGKTVHFAGQGETIQLAYNPDFKLVAVKNVSSTNKHNHEADLLRSCSHPNIVTVLNIYEFNTDKFLVLEFVNTINLLSALAAAHPILSDTGKALICREVVAGVVYLMGKEIIHGGVGPQNVLIGRDGSVKLTNFAKASALRRGSTELDRFTDLVGICFIVWKLYNPLSLCEDGYEPPNWNGPTSGHKDVGDFYYELKARHDDISRIVTHSYLRAANAVRSNVLVPFIDEAQLEAHVFCG